MPPLKTADDLLGAKHPKATYDQAVAAIKAAVAADPVGSHAWWNEARLLDMLVKCRDGDPTLMGDVFDQRRISSQTLIVAALWSAYRKNGIEADYAAALTVYNYAKNALGGDWHDSEFAAYIRSIP